MKSIILLLLCGAAMTTQAQRLTNYVSFGLGTSIEKNIEGCSEQNRTRYIASMAMYYRLTDRFSIGGEAIASGKLGLFGNSSCNTTNATTNTLQLSPSNPTASTVLLHGKMMLISYKEMEPYIDMGVGINTYSYSDPVKDAGKVKKRSFVFAPEVGINMYKFQFACKMILGAKTPSFNGTDTENNRHVALESIKAQQVYLTIGYQLFKL
ncbi:MAG TPA: hypothetical protein VD996_10180 [Chitinophagaceae bacterium]|nr:hypothetical protein [Chitinophagaceae bacterium]